MSDIYVVTCGSYSDYRIIAVFSEECKEIGQNLADSLRDGNLEIFELNPQIAFPKLQRREVTMWLENGDESIVRFCDEDYDSKMNLDDLAKVLPTKWEIYPRKPPIITVTCWANNNTHAIKIANEYRTRLLAFGLKDVAENWAQGKNCIDERDVTDIIKNALKTINEE